VRGTLSLLAIFYAAFRQPLSPQWAQLQRSWLALFRKYWQQSPLHREMMRARLAIFLILALAGFALAGHMVGIRTDAVMKTLIGAGAVVGCLSTWCLSRTRKFDLLVAVLQRIRIAMRAVDEAVRATAHVFAATSQRARFVLVLAQRTARATATTVRTHVGTCALFLTPRIAPAPRFAADIPAAA